MNPLHFVVSKQQKDKLLFIENIFYYKKWILMQLS